MGNFFIGILIGIGAILPGVSSGVFLVVFGLYEKLIDSILHVFRDFKKNLLFLSPIFLGAILSIFLFSKLLLFVFEKYYIYTCYVFLGLILGSIPAIRKQSNIIKPNFLHIMCFILSFVSSIYLIVIEKGNTYNISAFSNIYLIFTGFAMSAGIIIPGVSKTAILMILGNYSNYLTAISTLNIEYLIPIGIGLILGGVFFMYIINYLFLHFKSYTYCFILGFVIGSCFIIYPGFSLDFEYIISILLGFICFCFVQKIEKFKNSLKDKSKQ